MTYDQFLSHLTTHTGTFRFSYPGNKRCSITAERQIIFACDGTQIDTGRMLYRAAEGADTPGSFTSAAELLEAPIYEGWSIRNRWGEIKWNRARP